jgi:uncharacterized protein (TIGR02265 family)
VRGLQAPEHGTAYRGVLARGVRVQYGFGAASGMTPPPPANATSGTTFEGLFQLALKPTGAFADELRALGFDPSKPVHVEYPTSTWQACLEAARKHTFASLPAAEGYRRLGHCFVEGYLSTLTGKLLSAAAPLFSVDTMLKGLAHSWARSQPAQRATTQRVAEREWRITLEGPGIVAHFCAGLMEALLARAKVVPAVSVAETTQKGCTLSVRW